ncbi:DUF2812 domain-containing protein [Staphylococcus ureilyticus]|uniref:DUF2812 domain-containing protein n=1 Tax=Staphylococcus ureilyticus TaxID=94138 RepID=UPI001300B36F|nr:DUF2812 domain-containing protein [Staphylococcus ureilyticus]MBM9448521.1 DUF2812 domain-containing protein [Staphylococcus ureilyticus]
MTKRKFFKIFLNPIKEEKWINSYLKKGYKLVSVSLMGIYVFQKTNKHYVVRLDYRNFSRDLAFQEYIDIHEQFGWKHIYGNKFGVGNQYWEKISNNNDDLFSDLDSKVKHYQRIMNFLMCFSLLFFLYCLQYNVLSMNILLKKNEIFNILKNDILNLNSLKTLIVTLSEFTIRNLSLFIFIGFAIMYFKAYMYIRKIKKNIKENEYD